MEQKTALLVGATAGIGKETALLLTQAGYQVLMVGRNPAAGEALAADWGGVHPGRCVTDERDAPGSPNGFVP